MLLTYLSVMAGGAFGVAARMALSHWIGDRLGPQLPWGTILVNIIGCLAIGLVSGLGESSGGFLTYPLGRQVVMIGVLGGFTTFSAFSLQTVTLLANGDIFSAATNVLVSVVCCFLATWAGLALAGVLHSK